MSSQKKIEVFMSSTKNHPFKISYETAINGTSQQKLLSLDLADFTEESNLKLLADGEVGLISYSSDLDQEVLVLNSYHPLGYAPTVEHRFLLRKGIATTIELGIAEDLVKRLSPNYEVVIKNPTSSRIKQIERLGLQRDTNYTLGTYVRLLKQFLESREL